jgi:hypothetical protein
MSLKSDLASACDDVRVRRTRAVGALLARVAIGTEIRSAAGVSAYFASSR